MATVFQEPSEADILGQVIAPDQPTLSEPSAQAIIDLRFNQAISRMNELAEKNRQGHLTASEQTELERYQRVGNFLNLMQATARLVLPLHHKPSGYESSRLRSDAESRN